VESAQAIKSMMYFLFGDTARIIEKPSVRTLVVFGRHNYLSCLLLFIFFLCLLCEVERPSASWFQQSQVHRLSRVQHLIKDVEKVVVKRLVSSLLELTSSGLGHRGPSPPSHVLIGGNY
jgi:hypothetical protein